MNNIDYFKQDISVGDFATIELTSGKSVSGKVIKIGDCIIIEKGNGRTMRLLDGIIGGWELIDRYEPESVSTNEAIHSSSQGDKISTDESIKEDNDKAKDKSFRLADSSGRTEGGIDTETTSNSHLLINKLEPAGQTGLSGQTQDEKSTSGPLNGREYGLRILGKIDLSQFESPKKSNKNNASESIEKRASTKKDEDTRSATKAKMKSIGKSLDALSQIDKSTLSTDATLSLTPMGRITKIGPVFGYIPVFDTLILRYKGPRVL